MVPTTATASNQIIETVLSWEIHYLFNPDSPIDKYKRHLDVPKIPIEFELSKNKYNRNGGTKRCLVKSMSKARVESIFG